MKKVISQHEKEVYKFTNPTYMKFVPLKDFEAPAQQQNTTFFSAIKRFFSQLVTSRPIEDAIISNKKEDSKQQSSKLQKKQKNRLQYVKRLTNEDFLVGNEDQLDGISVVGIIDGFVDTMHLWSININKTIHHVIVDPRSKKNFISENYIIVIAKAEAVVYQFKPKSMEEKPEVVASIRTTEEVKVVQILKDGNFALFYAKGFEVFSVFEETKSIKSVLKKQYEIKNPNLRLFQIPQPFENMLNIFFEEITDKKEIFTLWNIEVEFLAKDVRMSKVSKVYELPYELRKAVTLQNYSKQIYFINLGEQIIAIKRGYILDSARVNKNTNDCHLRFFAQSKLLHISTARLEIYKFLLNANTIPAKISLQSTDSAEIPFTDSSYQYLEAIQVNGDNYGIFYQLKEKCNRSLHGQIKYAFVLTHQIKLEEKIQNILPVSVKDVNIEKIEEKADMATKMGLQRKNIYLRLWNCSAKCQVEDYQLLLDTLNYETIKSQIQKKLKKNSMNYRQLILIQQGCLSMLSADVSKENNTKQHIKNYMISHLLIRKLEFYKQISMIEKSQGKKISEGEGGKLLINIQNYNHFKTVDIKSMLIEFISQFCNEDKDHVQKIRAVFKHFRFSLRIIYLDILAELVVATKKKFVKILQQIPEILPYSLEAETGSSPLQGIWNQVTEQQWQKSLYIDTLVTIQNKENIQEICESVWFKRNWLTQQDYINFSRSQIQEIQAKNCSDTPFYRTIDKVFQVIKDYPTLRTIIDFLQDKYSKLPNHILGKIFLYNKLYEHFKANQKLIQIDEQKIGLFSQFLKWKDPQIFKAMFNYQKLKKGFILKQMKPLYAKLSSAQTFTQGLLNYFVSPLSEISDIKYLLNRMNNQKREFHEENEGLYEVLVRGMQLKLKIGGQSDIPADQVLIYIENIPLPQKNPVFKDLQTMRAINKETQRFKRMKLNMSIFEITKNMDAVIAAVVAHEVFQAQILNTRDFQTIREMSYRIIEDVESLKGNLYENSEKTDNVAFIYLTKLLEEEQLIPVVGKLIEDPWFSRFNFDEAKIENMVLFMYKWKLNKDPSYVNSSIYLKKLIEILPATNNCRMFIEAQVEIGIMLSTSQNHVLYPLNNGNEYFSSVELQKMLGCASGVHLLQIDIERLFNYVSIVQKIALDKAQPETTLKMLYEIIVIRLMDCNMLVQVFPKIRQLMVMCASESKNNFIYPCIIISKLAPQLVEQNKIILLDCASYLFKNPLQLLEILQQLIRLVSTTSEQRVFLTNTLKKCKNKSLTYHPENPLLDKMYTSLAVSKAQQQNLMNILKLHIRFVAKIKEEFSFAHFYNSFIILCNDPYVLPVYLYSIRYDLNFRDFRAFLSFVVKEQLFNKKITVQFARKMFIVLFEAIKHGRGIELLAEQLRKIPFQDYIDFDKNIETSTALQKVMVESIERMKNKGKIINNEQQKKIAKGLSQTKQAREKRIKERLNKIPTEPTNKEYPFVDSDDSSNKPYPKIKRNSLQVQKTTCDFDPSYERAILLARNSKNLRIYLSSYLQKQLKTKYNITREMRNNIFYDLSIDRDKAKLDKSADQINDAIRNSIRRSRSNKGDNVPSSQLPSEKSQPFLSVKPPTPLPEKQSVIVDKPEYKEVVLYDLPQAEIKVEILKEIQQIKKESDGRQVEYIQEGPISEAKTYLQPEIGQLPLGIESGRANQELRSDSRPLEEKQESAKLMKVSQEKEMEYLETPYLKLQALQSNQQEQAKNEVPDIGNSEAQIHIINTIINGQVLREQTHYDFQILEKYSKHEHFLDFLEELVKKLYDKFDITLEEILLFAKALSNAYSNFHINKIFLQIYEKADKLQTKFNLDLPLKSLLGPEGLFIPGNNTEILFKYLLPRIISTLNEEQLLKACKVITLSFKKSDLQQEIMFKYLLQLFSKYQQCLTNVMIASRQKGMLREKIQVILGKIPVKLLKKRQEQMMGSSIDPSVRIEVAKLIANSCKARYDVKIAEYFQSKYLSK